MNDKKKIIVRHKNTLTYPSSTLDPVISIVDQAKEIEKAHEKIQDKVNHQLDVILKQIRHLQEEARTIIDQAKDDMELHHIPCSFVKKPGETIYLYEKQNKEQFFSRVSPEEWGESLSYRFMGAYQITLDHGFKKLDHL